MTQHVKFTNDNYLLCEHLAQLTVECGHMMTNIEEESTRMYTELEGYNLFQLFSLNEGRGKKQVVKKCKLLDKQMNRLKIEGSL